MIRQSFKCRAAILRTLYLVAGIRSLHTMNDEITEPKDRDPTRASRLGLHGPGPCCGYMVCRIHFKPVARVWEVPWLCVALSAVSSSLSPHHQLIVSHTKQLSSSAALSGSCICSSRGKPYTTTFLPSNGRDLVRTRPGAFATRCLMNAR